VPVTYGRLSHEQRKVLKKHVQGRVVHDLGAGTGFLARKIARMGAEKVIAVEKDKSMIDPQLVDHPRVVVKHGVFGCVACDDMDVGFVSWPYNQESPVLLGLLRHAKTVVYLGKNTDATSCGWHGLFESFLERRVLDYVPEKRNTLIVYGERLRKPRTLKSANGEERAALTQSLVAKWLKFEEVETR